MKFPFPVCLALMTCFGHLLKAQDKQQNIPFSADTSRISSMTMSGLRKTRQTLSTDKVYYLTDPGKQGLFMPDPFDKTSLDDSAMTLVSTAGIRLKRIIDGKALNIRWFGATGNGSSDDWNAIQKGINYILNSGYVVRTLFFPRGNYRITHPLLIASFTGTSYRQVSITLEGPANSKDIATGSAIILPTFNNSFAIGIQLGKGVLIKDLLIKGRFTFPNKLNETQVDTLAFNEWTDGSARDNSRSPYAGIVIDPFSDSTAYPANSDMYPGLHAYCAAGISRSGSTAVQVTGCSIINFVVGIMITPSNQWNGELIDVIDCDISNNKVAYAMGQAQSKECHVERIKCWGNTHTIFDNVSYGIRHGDGAAVPMIDGVNIAGYAKQLCNIIAASFNGVFRNIYAEGLFRLGCAGGNATLSFEDCQLNFSTLAPGIPYPDFFVLGSGATFHSCMLRHYAGAKGMRLILSGSHNCYEDGVMNEPPVALILKPCDCSTPSFRNIVMYYSGGILGGSNRGFATGLPFPRPSDPVYYGSNYLLLDSSSGIDLVYKLTYNNTYERDIQLSGTPIIHVNKSKWTAWFTLGKASDANLLKKGDFILTAGLPYQDQFTRIIAPTNPVGFVESIDHDTVHLRNLAYGIGEGIQLSLWMDYYIYEKGIFTGNIAAGSKTIENVEGQFPLIGERLDIPMLPSGSYVTAVDPMAQTISFSNANNSGRSFSDYTFSNGYPSIEIHSAYCLSDLQKYHKTLIGKSTFYLHALIDKDIHDPAYLLGGNVSEKYSILNTNIRGDTSLHKLRYMPDSH